jgi:hypothetical protein
VWGHHKIKGLAKNTLGLLLLGKHFPVKPAYEAEASLKRIKVS